MRRWTIVVRAVVREFVGKCARSLQAMLLMLTHQLIIAFGDTFVEVPRRSPPAADYAAGEANGENA